MANTVTTTVLASSVKEVFLYTTIVSDGSEETDLVVYDSSAIATLVGDTDPLTCRLARVIATVCSAATARVTLEFDATTDVLALGIPAGTNPTDIDFYPTVPLPNYAGTGRTGDILLTTTGLESGDTITMVLRVLRK